MFDPELQCGSLTVVVTPRADISYIYAYGEELLKIFFLRIRLINTIWFHVAVEIVLLTDGDT